MGYRDPNEALRAENDSLQQQLKAAQEELDALRHTKGASQDDIDQHRWAMGMRCLGGVALMLPFLLMTAVCERRMMPRYQDASPRLVAGGFVGSSAFIAPAAPTVAPAALPAVQRPNVMHACQNRAEPLVGFEQFTSSVERSARVLSSENYPGLSAGTPCTVRVVPVAMQDFNCHVEVVCNGQTVYGTLPTGYAHCDVDRSGIAILAHDADITAADGDPAVQVDILNQRAIVLDTVNGTPRRLRMVLDAPPRFE